MADGRHEYGMQATKLVTQVNMITKKKRHAWRRPCLLQRYSMGGSRGSLAVCAQSCRAKSLGLGLRSPTNSTEVNSALSIQSSSPRFCTKTSGGLGLVQGWGAGTRGQGPRGLGRDRGATEARRFPVRVCQCRGAAPPPSSLARVPGPRRAVQSFPFPQAGLLHS